jgi:hypothetical protein
LKRIGIEPGKSFDFAKADPILQRALERASVDGLATMKAKTQTLALVFNSWQMNTDTMGVYGDCYLKRAIVALVGLGANQPGDAIYPFNLTDNQGKPLEGAKTRGARWALGSAGGRAGAMTLPASEAHRERLFPEMRARQLCCGRARRSNQ